MISPKIIFKGFVKMLSLVAIALLLAVVLRVFLFSTFKIPSDSMAPALKSGDYIIALKLIPGPRVCKNFDFLENNSKPEFWRLKGIRTIKRNDVLVFHFPYSNWNKLTMDMNKFYVKRCVAIPGDSFYIENGIYKVKGCTESLGNVNAQRKIGKRDSSSFAPEVYRCFPKSKALHWNIRNFGPFYVPRKGDVLKMDSVNFSLYRKLIEYETGLKVKKKNNTVLLNDSLISIYTFTTNYYFMAGDLVRDSRDSRYWGLLPEDHIVGKAAIVWKSVDPYSGDVRWKRVMRAVK
jgi:signal peptidase I